MINLKIDPEFQNQIPPHWRILIRQQVIMLRR